MNIRKSKESDIDNWANLRNSLWPDTIAKHRNKISEFFSGASTDIVEALLLETAEYELVGFVELNFRNYAEGSQNAVIPYIEGWFISERYRGNGYGKQLIQAAEEWAKNQGYYELASDTELTNKNSIQIHYHLGFKETERLVCFLKYL